MQVFSPLVGVSFRGKEVRELVKTLTPDDGHLLSLEAEPDNEYDDHAVKVLYDVGSVHLGYVAREANAELFEELQAGSEFEIEVTGFENSIKPVLLITKVEEGSLTDMDLSEIRDPNIGD